MSRSKILQLVVFAAVAMVTIAAAPTVLVVDSSGSMWGQIGGKAKVEIARGALDRLIHSLEAGSELGVVAYGHRREADCADIEVVAPIGPVAADPLVARLSALTPKGKTPLAASIEEAFRLVGPKPGKVVLVSDGLETCDPDPCARVARLRGGRSDLVLHVVGFGLGAESRAQLECLAQAGGGLYFEASDAKGLEEALGRAREQTAGDSVLEVKVTVDGKLADASVHVLPPGAKGGRTEDEVAGARTYDQAATNPRRFALPAGAYVVEVVPVERGMKAARRRFEDVALSPAAPHWLDVDFGSGEVVVTVRRNGALSDATVQVRPVGETTAVVSGRTYTQPTHNPARYRVPSGKYEVVIGSVEIAGRPSVLRTVDLAAGSSVAVEASFESGSLRVGASRSGALVDATVAVKGADGREVDRSRTYVKPNTNPCTFTLPPGRYTIEVAAVKLEGRPKRSLAVEVAAGAEVRRDAEFGN